MKRKYTIKKIRNYIIWSGIFQGVGLSSLMFFCLYTREKNFGWLFGLIIAIAVIDVICLYKLYRYSYVPAIHLQKLIDDYLEVNESERLINRSSNEDLVQEIKEILSSLDTIAIQQKNAEILMKNAEINNLQDQINPHFLYNTLEVIRGEALLNGDRKIAEMTASLANYFRYNISRKETFVFLKDELKNSMNYFNIQKNRFGDKIACEILYHDTDEGIVGNCYIPKLILQPVIENAIYHGLELKMGPGTIKIHISTTETSLYIVVSDDGLGMPTELLDELNSDYNEEKEERSDRHNGVAIQNIKNRLNLYWGKQAYLIATSELGEGTQIHLCMPLLYQKEEYMN